MASTASDYREILRVELATRCQHNPRYSLRAFARDLKVAPSRLSEILSGKQGLSRKTGEVIAKRIGMTPSEIEHFCDLISAADARSREERETAKKKLQKKQKDVTNHALQLDVFRMIADWYHLAILGLAQLKDFQNDARWIARKLQISEPEAVTALDRLERLGLISRAGDAIRLAHRETNTESEIASESIRKFHHQILQKAISALYLQPVEMRDYSAMIMPIDQGQLEKARTLLKDFSEDFSAKMEADETKSAVYCLSMQLFSLSEEPHEAQQE